MPFYDYAGLVVSIASNSSPHVVIYLESYGGYFGFGHGKGQCRGLPLYTHCGKTNHSQWVKFVVRLINVRKICRLFLYKYCY